MIGHEVRHQALTRKEGEKGKMASRTIKARFLGRRVNRVETYQKYSFNKCFGIWKKKKIKIIDGQDTVDKCVGQSREDMQREVCEEPNS